MVKKKAAKPWLLPAIAGLFVAGLIGGLVTLGSSGSSNPLQGSRFYVDSESHAALQEQEWRESKPAEAEAMARLAALPTSKWLTSTESLGELDVYLKKAYESESAPVLVAYNLPGRDCGLYSAGGEDTAKAYRKFIDNLSGHIRRNQGNQETKTVIIVEPDALPAIRANDSNGKPCLSESKRQERFELLRYAVRSLKALPRTAVYIDAGHSGWVKDTADMAGRLEKAGVSESDGFSLNISNFQTTAASAAYGQAIAGKIAGKHFVIDTSRNGNGPFVNPKYKEFSWCNPPGRALGHFPTAQTGQELVDAYLYIKVPGESDGQDNDPDKCFGGPPAGQWNAEYALGLVDRWPTELQPR